MILITGANGRLGKHISAYFARKGLKPRLMVQEKAALGGRNIVVADLFDEDSLLKACKGAGTIVHLAGTVDYTLPPKEMTRINYDGTKNMLDAASNAGVSKFVYASSVAVYGNQDNFPIREDFELNAKEPYGISKKKAEDYIRNSGIKYTTLRPTAVYGKGFDIGLGAVFKLMKSGNMRIVGDGENKAHFVHVNDCVQAFYLAAKNKALDGAVNVAGPEAMTQTKLLRLIAEKIGAEPPRKHINKNIAMFGSKVMYNILKSGIADGSEKSGKYLRMCRWLLFFFNTDYDISKAKRILGYKPVVGYGRGLDDVLKNA